MASVFGFTRAYPLLQILKSLQMQLVPSVSGPFIKGQWSYGTWVISQSLSPLPTRNFFLWLLPGMYGVLSGARGMSGNDGVVHILNSCTSKIPCLMHFLHNLLFSSDCHSFSFSAEHVPGVNNQLADALSRFHWQEFQQLAPDAQPFPMFLFDIF